MEQQATGPESVTYERVELSAGEFTLQRHQLPARFAVAGLGETDDLSLYAIEAGEPEEMLYAKATDIAAVIEITVPGTYRWRSMADVRTYLRTE